MALKESDIQFGGRLGQPDMTYGWSKLTGEYLARIAHQHYGLHTACVRPFSGYGEEQDLSYPGAEHRAACSQARESAHGLGQRTAGARLRAHRRLHRGDACASSRRVNDGSAVNIGSGKLINFREVARLFASLEGYEAEIKPVEDKPVGVHSRYADISHMKKILDWQPTISVEEGFRRVLRVAHERKAQGL